MVGSRVCAWCALRECVRKPRDHVVWRHVAARRAAHSAAGSSARHAGAMHERDRTQRHTPNPASSDASRALTALTTSVRIRRWTRDARPPSGLGRRVRRMATHLPRGCGRVAVTARSTAGRRGRRRDREAERSPDRAWRLDSARQISTAACSTHQPASPRFADAPDGSVGAPGRGRLGRRGPGRGRLALVPEGGRRSGGRAGAPPRRLARLRLEHPSVEHAWEWTALA